MTTCRSLDEIHAAALAEHDGPLTQDQADLVAAILAPHMADLDASPTHGTRAENARSAENRL
jgi:hypothetical protein